MSDKLTIVDLVDVDAILRKNNFFPTKWDELGRNLGLRQPTIEVIKSTSRDDSRKALTETLSKWLSRADDVDKRGKPSWTTLTKAIRKMEDCVGVAEGIEIEKGIASPQTSDETASKGSESIDAEIACEVLSENIGTIIQSQIPLPSVVEYLLTKKIISEAEKLQIMDTHNTMNIDDRWRKLIGIVQATIKLDGEAFITLKNAIEKGGTVKETKLAEKLDKIYEEKKATKN